MPTQPQQLTMNQNKTIDSPPKVLSPHSEYCKSCSKEITEGRAFELGDHKWHVDCFRCSKCSSLLGIDSEFLVVGNGDLVCNKCYYDCQICGKVIDDMAIIAGGQPFCSSCFVCKLCKKSIDNIRYARTSNGLYCMNCHDKIERKKKKHELKKKRQLQKLNTFSSSGSNSAAIPKSANSLSSPSIANSSSSIVTPSSSSLAPVLAPMADHLISNILSTSGSASSSKNSSPVYEKSLPSIPTGLSLNQVERQHASIANFSSPFESEDKSSGLLSPISFTELNDESLFKPDSFSLFTPVSGSSTTTIDAFQQAMAAASNSPATITTSNKTNNSEKITQQTVQYTTTRIIPKLSTPPTYSNNVKKLSPPVSAKTITESNPEILDNSKSKPSTLPSENTTISSNEALRSFNSNNNSLNEIPVGFVHASISKSLNPTAITQNYRSTSSTSNNSSMSSSTSSLLQKQKKKEDQSPSDVLTTNNVIQTDNGSSTTTFPQLSKIKEEIENLTNTKNNLSREVTELSKTMQKLKLEIENERQSLVEAKQYNRMLKNGGLVSSDIINSKILDSNKNKLSGNNNTKNYSPLTEKFSSSLKAIKLPGTNHHNTSHENHHRADSYESFESNPVETSIANKSSSQMIHSLSTNSMASNSQVDSSQIGLSPRQYLQSDESSNNLEVPKPKSKRFWRNKGFFSSSSSNHNNNSTSNIPSSGGEILDYSSNDEDDDEDQDDDHDSSEVTLKNKMKISAPVVSHQIDQETFKLMKQNQKHNGDSGLTISLPVNLLSASKIGFLDKFSMSVSSGGASSNGETTGHNGNAPLNNVSASIKTTMPSLSSPITSVSGGASSVMAGVGNTGTSTGLVEPINGKISHAGNEVKKHENLTLIEKSRQEKREIPLIVTTCLKYVERYGLNIEGIYRKSGSTSQIQQLEQAFDNYANDREELERCIHLDIHVVSSVLKRYLRRLKEPLIPYAHYDEYIKCGTIKKQSKKIDSLKNLLKKFPKEHYLTLTLLCKHLNTIAKYSDVNLMNLHNLSIVFAPSLVRDLASERDMIDMASKNDVTEFLVTNYKIILT